MMKYVLFAATILAAPLAVSAAFAQSDTVAAGEEAHHSESYDSTSTTPAGTVATHQAIEDHSNTDSTVGADGAPAAAATSTTTDVTHTTHSDDTND